MKSIVCLSEDFVPLWRTWENLLSVFTGGANGVAPLNLIGHLSSCRVVVRCWGVRQRLGKLPPCSPSSLRNRLVKS